jgi:hypothetical protein
LGEKLIIRYDEIGDFLFIEVCNPYPEQDSNEIDESKVARFNLKTGEIETVEILFFRAWLKQEGEIRIPVNATLRLANTSIPTEAAYSASLDKTLSIRYHQVIDILAIGQVHTHPGQTEAEIGENAVARMNPRTGEIENLEVRHFQAHMERDGEIVLPINATLRPNKSVVAAN